MHFAETRIGFSPGKNWTYIGIIFPFVLKDAITGSGVKLEIILNTLSCFLASILQNFCSDVNGERRILGRPKVVCGSKVPVLTSYAGLNPNLCTTLSLAASLVSGKSRLVIFILCTQPYGFACQPLRGLVPTLAKPGRRR